MNGLGINEIQYYRIIKIELYSRTNISINLNAKLNHVKKEEYEEKK